MQNSQLQQLLSTDERSAISKAVVGKKPHPVLHLLDGEEEECRQIAVNTDRALKHVMLRDKAWIDKLKPRLVQTADLAEPASALSEIRSYGALLEAGIQVSPVKVGQKPTPEFSVQIGSANAQVEVHAKQFDHMTDQQIEDHHQALAEELQEKLNVAPPGQTVMAVRMTEVFPFGEPDAEKPGDTTTTNAISRLCSIKAREHQFEEGTPSILWLDFQDPHSWNMSLTADQLRPVHSWHGMLTSGALWYAFFGWKGAPVFDRFHRSLNPRAIVEMAHPGRFRLSKMLSAVVISLPTETVLVESPRPIVRLADDFRCQFIHLPWAKVEHWTAEWEPDLVRRTIDLESRMLLAIAGNGAACAPEWS